MSEKSVHKSFNEAPLGSRIQLSTDSRTGLKMIFELINHCIRAKLVGRYNSLSSMSVLVTDHKLNIIITLNLHRRNKFIICTSSTRVHASCERGGGAGSMDGLKFPCVINSPSHSTVRSICSWKGDAKYATNLPIQLALHLNIFSLTNETTSDSFLLATPS